MQIAQNKQPAKQEKRQNASYEGRRRAARPVATTAGLWWTPRTVVAATASLWWLPPAVVALPLPGHFGFVRYFGFPRDAFRLLLVFGLKMENVSGLRECVGS